jgi:hypothetical protein
LILETLQISLEKDPEKRGSGAKATNLFATKHSKLERLILGKSSNPE